MDNPELEQHLPPRAAAFLSNNEDVPEGRRAGSGAWAGINYMFY
jgi:hypothetical protein